MKVKMQVVINVEVEGPTPSENEISASVIEAVENAILDREENGFDHTLSETTSLTLSYIIPNGVEEG